MKDFIIKYLPYAIIALQMFWAGSYWNENWSRNLETRRKIVVIAIAISYGSASIFIYAIGIPCLLLWFLWKR